MDSHTNYISLYSGGAGLDIGFQLALPGSRAVCYVERDVAACALLVERIEAEQLDDAPIWSDSSTFNGEPWHKKVDFIIGGFPCQPWSVGGEQKGTSDERWLWPDIARIVREVQPAGLFLENVPPLISGGGLAEVLRDLAELGFDAEWDLFRASDVGAPHRRERVFIVAHRNNESGDICNGEWWYESCRKGVELADTEEIDARRRHPTPIGAKSISGQCVDMGNSNRSRLQRRRRTIERTDKLTAWPPGPADTDAWTATPERYWPATEPEVRGVVDGLARGMARTEQLRILGNGVVPQQAALAFRELAIRLNHERFYKRA